MRVITTPILLIILLLSFYKALAFQNNNSISQNNNDSITSFISKTTTINRDAENIIYDAVIIKKNYHNAILYATSYLEKGTATDNNLIKFKANYWLAYANYYNSNNSKTIHHVNEALKIVLKDKKEREFFSLLTIKGGAYMRMNAYEKAIHIFLQANNYSEKKEISLEEKLLVIQNIGRCRIRIKRYKDAIKNFEFVLTTIKDSTALSSLGTYNQKAIPFNASNALGICYRELDLYDEALTLFSKNLELQKTENNQYNIAICYMNIGMTLNKSKKKNKGLEYLKKAREIFISKEIRSENFLIVNYQIANILYEFENYEQCYIYLHENYEILRKNRKIQYADDMMKLAIKNAKQIDNQKAESSYIHLLTEIQEELYQDRSIAKDLVFDNDRKKLTSSYQQLYDSNKKNKVISIYIGLLAFGIITGLIILFRKTKKKNIKLFNELERKLYKKTEKTSSSFIDDNKVTKILEQLSILEKSLFFIDPMCTLHTTSKHLKTNTTYLSKIINKYKEKSFNDYINEQRVFYILDQLKKDPKYKYYTIKAISEDIGYGSVNTFNTAFKKITNISPSFYIKQLNNKVNINA